MEQISSVNQEKDAFVTWVMKYLKESRGIYHVTLGPGDYWLGVDTYYQDPQVYLATRDFEALMPKSPLLEWRTIVPEHKHSFLLEISERAINRRATKEV